MIHIIIGSTRQARFGDKPAAWIAKLLKQQRVDYEILDLKEWNLPFYDEPVSPKSMKAYNADYVSPVGKKWAQKVAEADGYIIITAEYNHGYTGVLKNALDYAYNEWNNKPVSFISYGGVAAGTRATQQLKQVLLELKMMPVHANVHISFYWEKLDKQGNFDFAPYENAANAMIKQLLPLSDALKMLRK